MMILLQYQRDRYKNADYQGAAIPEVRQMSSKLTNTWRPDTQMGKWNNQGPIFIIVSKIKSRSGQAYKSDLAFSLLQHVIHVFSCGSAPKTALQFVCRCAILQQKNGFDCIYIIMQMYSRLGVYNYLIMIPMYRSNINRQFHQFLCL